MHINCKRKFHARGVCVSDTFSVSQNFIRDWYGTSILFAAALICMSSPSEIRKDIAVVLKAEI